MLSLPVGSMHAMRPAFPPIFVYQTLAAEVYTSLCCDTQMSAFSDIAHTCNWLIMQFPFQWRCEAKPGLISKSLLCILLILIGIFQKLKKSELILNQPALQFALDSTVGNLKHLKIFAKLAILNIWKIFGKTGNDTFDDSQQKCLWPFFVLQADIYEHGWNCETQWINVVVGILLLPWNKGESASLSLQGQS